MKARVRRSIASLAAFGLVVGAGAADAQKRQTNRELFAGGIQAQGAITDEEEEAAIREFRRVVLGRGHRTHRRRA